MFYWFVCFAYCLTIFASVIEAPELDTDYMQNPSSIEWKKIDSEHFEVIFPAEIENEAQRVTHLLEKAWPFVTRSLETVPPRISIVLQNQTTASNGFVTLAPRRSEWFITPAIDPELSNTEWLKTLAIHEFRHVVQFHKSRQNFNRYFEVFLGEYGQALGLGLSFPPWFLEGDAVGIETALTRGGRGRIPVFERDLRTLLLSGKDFDYDRAHLGSYHDYIPNHYVYGYFYTSYLRNQEGDLFLSHLANEATRKSYNPLTFYHSYQRLTGRTFEEFYRSTMMDLSRLWKEKYDLLKPTPYMVKNLPRKYGWSNYFWPQPLGDGRYLALKQGLSHYSQFVITGGKEDEVVVYPSNMLSDYPVKVRSGRFSYVEAEVDPRWGVRDYSRIRVWDLQLKKHILDLRKTKGRMAVLNQSGSLVMYVEWDEKQNQYIVVNNLNQEEVLRMRYPSDRVITSLDWFGENHAVMVVKGREDQKEVVKVNIKEQLEEIILPPDYINHGYVAVYGEHILLESPRSGIDNIYLVENGGLKQITSSRFGAYAPVLWDNKLVYNEYTVDGMDIVQKDRVWDSEENSGESFVSVYEKFAVNEDRNQFERILFDQQTWPVQDYSQVRNALNFHSWIFLAPPLTSTITLMAVSRDVLNNFSLSYGGEHDLNEGKSKAFVSSAWSHHWPVFDLRAAYGGREQDLLVAGNEIENEWEEGTFEAGLSLPWKFLEGRFTHAFSVRVFSKLIKVTNKLSADRSQVLDGALHSPGMDLSYRTASRMARRDINPEWGFNIMGHYEEGKDITGTGQEGTIAAIDTVTFLPGILKHHSFYHQLSYENQRDRNYQYSSFVQKPRGTRSFYLEEFRKWSANYLAPLFYPDWHLWRYLYLKRVSANIFYDELNGRSGRGEYKAASTGWELLTELNFFRIFIPITIGLRANYVLTGREKDNSYEIFLATFAGTF